MGVETALIAATTLSATSTLASGYQAYEQGKYEEEQAEADAAAARASAKVEAGRIRDIAKRQRSKARAALASSGVQVDVGTGADLQQDILQAGEQDAMTNILNGRTVSNRINAEGDMAALRGRQALGGSVLAAGGDVAYGRWKRMDAKQRGTI